MFSGVRCTDKYKADLNVRLLILLCGVGWTFAFRSGANVAPGTNKVNGLNCAGPHLALKVALMIIEPLGR